MSISPLSGYGNSQAYAKLGSVNAESTQPSDTVRTAQQKQGRSAGGSTPAGATTVSLSAEALFALSQTSETSSAAPTYAKFFPAREGFSATNLAAAVEDPGAQPFSQNRPFAEVAQAARESLDDKYQQMRESGQAYDKNSSEGIDRSSLFGDLDRRALYAVASNEGGLFSEDEQ